MARLSKARAARQLGISRTSLYKLISKGRVSATADGLIDETELVRVAPYVDTFKDRTQTSMDTRRERPWTSMDTPVHVPLFHAETPHEHLVDSVHEQGWTPVHDRPQTSMDDLVEVLREHLRLAQDREHRYEARERAYQEHIAQLTTMLDQAHQQNQRLLDMPRPVYSPQPPPSLSRPAAHPQGTRGPMRQRILTLLQEYPEGLTHGEMRPLLEVEKSLLDTVSGMLRDGLVRRVARGRYVVRAVPGG